MKCSVQTLKFLDNRNEEMKEGQIGWILQGVKNVTILVPLVGRRLGDNLFKVSDQFMPIDKDVEHNFAPDQKSETRKIHYFS